ncbi:hypothetical protein D1159_00730 [Pseudoflavonifractor sp. 524-17]|uniref:hypothetical protein n=1 Tax=Pseudoflavonifractor sp. 524-17 TaxID=2304577 RepID=UPI00137A55A9|nr:hypothetical protein [Pseudoflavonifractor sp. 524-17]NCE63137.1 hypothetical protein [Pseudoflavonifractor sp. 524-17]
MSLRRIGAAIICLLIGTGIWLLAPWAPFSHLRQEDVARVDALFGTYPPVTLTQADQQTLVTLLGQVRLTRLPDYPPSAGRGTERFLLHMADGSELTVQASDPAFFVNNRGYLSASFDRAAQDALLQIGALNHAYIDPIRAAGTPRIRQIGRGRHFAGPCRFFAYRKYFAPLSKRG